MTEETKTCPDCGETVKAVAILCRHCKYDFKAGRSAAPLDEGPPAPRKSSVAVAIVIVIVSGFGLMAVTGIIAAIAIPGLLASQRASNERNASASLKMLASAQADFRFNDRDASGVNDFWTGDVAGLYCLTPSDVKGNRDPMIKLIELSVAAADHAPLPDGAADGEYASIERVTARAPKAGYRFGALEANAEGEPYHDGSLRNPSEFAACAFPSNRKSGRRVFLLNEKNTIYAQSGDLSPVAKWPSDEELRFEWTKLD